MPLWQFMQQFDPIRVKCVISSWKASVHAYKIEWIINPRSLQVCIQQKALISGTQWLTDVLIVLRWMRLSLLCLKIWNRKSVLILSIPLRVCNVWKMMNSKVTVNSKAQFISPDPTQLNSTDIKQFSASRRVLNIFRTGWVELSRALWTRRKLPKTGCDPVCSLKGCERSFAARWRSDDAGLQPVMGKVVISTPIISCILFLFPFPFWAHLYSHSLGIPACFPFPLSHAHLWIDAVLRRCEYSTCDWTVWTRDSPPDTKLRPACWWWLLEIWHCRSL